MNSVQLNDNTFADLKDGRIHSLNRWTLQPSDGVLIFIYFSSLFLVNCFILVL